MSSDDQQFLDFGRMVFGLIAAVMNTPADETAYGRRSITMPDGEGGKLTAILFVAKNEELAELWERAARDTYSITDVILPSSERTH